MIRQYISYCFFHYSNPLVICQAFFQKFFRFQWKITALKQKSYNYWTKSIWNVKSEERCLQLRIWSAILNIREQQRRAAMPPAENGKILWKGCAQHVQRYGSTSDYRGTSSSSHFDPERNSCCTHRGSKEKCERLFFCRNACMMIGILRYNSRRLFLYRRGAVQELRRSDCKHAALRHTFRVCFDASCQSNLFLFFKST